MDPIILSLSSLDTGLSSFWALDSLCLSFLIYMLLERHCVKGFGTVRPSILSPMRYVKNLASINHPLRIEHFVYSQTFPRLELRHTAHQTKDCLRLFLIKSSSCLSAPSVLLHEFFKGVLE